MRAAGIFVAVLALLTAGIGCSDKEKAQNQPLSSAGFKSKVAAAIVTRTDLQAEPRGAARVEVSSTSSLDTLSLDVAKAYSEYSAHHDRLDAIVARLVGQAETSMAKGNSEESFATVRSFILPLLKPKGAFRRLTEQPAATPFPGDLRVAYGVQRRGSFMVVTPADLARWRRPLAELHRIALENLIRETNRDQPLRCEEKLCGWASGDGYDATRMIVPELRRQIVHKIGPAVYAVPRESVYVALPIKLAGRIREKVVRDFVTAPNPVSADIFVERGGELVVLPK